MANPFEPWLPMYGPGTLPERPMWRVPTEGGAWTSAFGGMFGGLGAIPPRPDPERRVRIDGRTLVLDREPPQRPDYKPGAPRGWVFIGTDEAGKPVAKRPLTTPETGWPVDAVDEAMAWLDEHDPVLPPPRMVGQVWVSGREVRSIVTTIRGRVVWGRDSAEVLADVQDGWDPLSFPPRAAVLVAGPTPWGRDVPWAPPGWTPTNG